MKAFTSQLVLCLVEVACLKIIGRITQRLNAKNVEESGCGSDKRHEKIYISFFFWVENSSFFFGAFCLLSELNGDVVTWKKCKGGSAKGILQKGLEFNFQELPFSQTDGWNCIVS